MVSRRLVIGIQSYCSNAQIEDRATTRSFAATAGSACEHITHVIVHVILVIRSQVVTNRITRCRRCVYSHVSWAHYLQGVPRQGHIINRRIRVFRCAVGSTSRSECIAVNTNGHNAVVIVQRRAEVYSNILSTPLTWV